MGPKFKPKKKKKKKHFSGKCSLFALKTREKFFPFFPNCTCKKSRQRINEDGINITRSA
jgi:hypothetical protein